MSRSVLRSSAPVLAAAVLAAALAPALAAVGNAPAARTSAAPQTKTVAPTPAQRGYQVVARSCFKCHGEGSQLSDLDLRTQALALKGGKHGASLVPGKAAQSRLYRMVAGLDKVQMPPTGALSEADVKAVRAWIDAGAPYPATAAAKGDGRWWAFRPVGNPTVPTVKDPWIRNPIDSFLLAKMKSAGVRPSAPADRRTLIRRATLDLHGVPPTPEEIEAFVTDPSADAYERLVDRLLASPRYGERWARHWLDLARYAESEGFKADEPRPNAWRYRDYVIRSLNEDKPYDRFIKEQIAGDEIDPHNPQALVATGFNRHWADESNARNIPLRRQEILNDITDTVGAVFMGVTLGCARCHDHKYDAITQKDYYRIQAFFAAAQPRDDVPLVPREKLEEYRQAQARWEEASAPTRERLAALEAPYRVRLMKDKRMPFPPEVQDAIDTAPARRTPLQWQVYLKVLPQITLKDEDVGKAMKGEDKTQWETLRAEMAKLAPMQPPALPVALGITDVGRDAPKVHTLAVGVYDQRLEEVQPGFLSAIDSRPPRIVPPAEVTSTGRRTALATWLADGANPLTARVMVNRLWQGHFGRGIVPTANDFGKAGEAATHPELLDWLAREMVRGGWSLKAMHRLMMTSAAYRQASDYQPAMAAKDPDNRLLWRYRRWRLEAEALRDACLSVSGELNPKMGGPSVLPELPQGAATAGWEVTPEETERNRRSVYVFVKRNARYPLFEAFDFPDTHEPCARRSNTNTAPQALMLFNSDLAVKWAQAMAGRLLREASTPEARVERAYRLAFGRAPDTEERRLSVQFLQSQAAVVKARKERGEPLVLPVGGPGGADAAEGAALVDLCHALMNANEFLYVD